MPIYEYTCLSCGKSFSLLQKVGSTEKDTTCPHCGSR
ncbi:MAG: zinc ribbon domain-containing protein, partial [Nitrospirae bacterium]